MGAGKERSRLEVSYAGLGMMRLSLTDFTDQSSDGSVGTVIASLTFPFHDALDADN